MKLLDLIGELFEDLPLTRLLIIPFPFSLLPTSLSPHSFLFRLGYLAFQPVI